MYRIVFSVREWPLRNDVALWVIAGSVEGAIKKARAHARKTFDDKRPVLKGSVLVGTIDVP